MNLHEFNGYEIVSQAPTRISLVGGGTDICPYPELYGGSVLNATISIYMSARLRIHQDEKIVIHANTRAEPISYPSLRKMEFDGQLDFIKAIIGSLYKAEEGFDLYIYSSLPMHSGLGGSGTMCVTVLGVFNHILGRNSLNNYELAELAHKIETKDLGNASGRQDQYAAAFGGMNHFEFVGSDNVRVNRVDLPGAGRRILNQALILLWLGERKASGAIIRDQADKIEKGGPALEAMHATKELVVDMREAVQSINILRIGELLDAAWEKKKCFSSHITTPQIDEIYSRLKKAGMIGGKITGAGGGGHLLACCDIEQRDMVLSVAEEMGLRNVPFSFVNEGVLSWQSKIRTVSGGPQG